MTDYPIILLEEKLPEREGLLPGVVVLRDFGPSRPHRYVTHQGNRSGQENLDGYYWGHYFGDLVGAVADFHERCVDKHIVASSRPVYLERAEAARNAAEVV